MEYMDASDFHAYTFFAESGGEDCLAQPNMEHCRVCRSWTGGRKARAEEGASNVALVSHSRGAMMQSSLHQRRLFVWIDRYTLGSC